MRIKLWSATDDLGGGQKREFSAKKELIDLLNQLNYKLSEQEDGLKDVKALREAKEDGEIELSATTVAKITAVADNISFPLSEHFTRLLKTITTKT